MIEHTIRLMTCEPMPIGWIFTIHFELGDGTKGIEVGSAENPALAGRKAFSNFINGLDREAEYRALGKTYYGK